MRKTNCFAAVAAGCVFLGSAAFAGNDCCWDWSPTEAGVDDAGKGDDEGLLAGTQADGTLIHWIGGALGYVLVAFVVALVNAALVSVLSRVRVCAGSPGYLPGSAGCRTRLVPQTFSCFPLFAIPVSQPRAPPV